MPQIISCLNYLHDSAHVVHSDLRPCNILLDQPHDFGNIKIIDFDESVCVKDPSDQVREKRGLGKGVEHKRPRSIAKSQGSTPKPTVELWHSHVPYSLWRISFISEHSIRGASLKDAARNAIRRMNKSKLKFPTEPQVSDAAKDLIASLLHPNYWRRPTAAKGLTHRWFVQTKQQHSTTSLTTGNALPDPNVKFQKMTRISNLRKYNPNSRLKQATLAIIAA